MYYVLLYTTKQKLILRLTTINNRSLIQKDLFHFQCEQGISKYIQF
jgi:hypothetical protein